MHYYVILILSMECLAHIQVSSCTGHEPSNDTELFRNLLKNARHIVVITGAGISADSGIPTYRGTWGDWRGYKAIELDSLEMFKREPALVWEFNQYRRNMVMQSMPNAAHKALAEYEMYLKSMHSKSTFTIITQNIDALHNTAGSTDVIEMHGSLFKTRCLRCSHITPNWNDPICPAFKNRGSPENLSYPEIKVEELPHCNQPDCTGLLRPFIVWYGEQLGKVLLAKAESALRKCDLCLVIGTSSVVNPVAMYAPRLAAVGIPVAEFNIEHTVATPLFQFFFKGPSSITVPKLLDLPR